MFITLVLCTSVLQLNYELYWNMSLLMTHSYLQFAEGPSTAIDLCSEDGDDTYYAEHEDVPAPDVEKMAKRLRRHGREAPPTPTRFKDVIVDTDNVRIFGSTHPC